MTPLRRRLSDVAAILGSMLVALSLAVEADSSGRVVGEQALLQLVLGCVGCLGLGWRRRAPVAVAVALVPFAAVTDFVAGAVLVSVFTVVKYQGRRAIVTVVALHALASIVPAVLYPDPAMDITVAIGVGFGLLTIAVAAGLAARSRRELVDSLRERAVRAEAEAGLRAEQLRALERERIAREMHDVLAHRISLVSLHAGALEIRPDLSTEQVARAARTIRASAHQALEDLREILGVLRGGTELTPPQSLTGLDDLVAGCRAAGVRLLMTNEVGRLDGLAASVSRTAYRVVQEGLTNASKHAAGAPVEVVLARTPDLHLVVRNPVTRGAAIPGARSGLVGLAERVTLAGGRLEHGVRPGPDGVVEFRLEAWLPWNR